MVWSSDGPQLWVIPCRRPKRQSNRARADDQFIANAAFSVSAKLPESSSAFCTRSALGPFACLICARRRCFERRDRHLRFQASAEDRAAARTDTTLTLSPFSDAVLRSAVTLTDGQALLGDGQFGSTKPATEGVVVVGAVGVVKVDEGVVGLDPAFGVVGS